MFVDLRSIHTTIDAPVESNLRLPFRRPSTTDERCAARQVGSKRFDLSNCPRTNGSRGPMSASLSQTAINASIDGGWSGTLQATSVRALPHRRPASRRSCLIMLLMVLPSCPLNKCFGRFMSHERVQGASTENGAEKRPRQRKQQPPSCDCGQT
jgi:hypothetical protein